MQEFYLPRALIVIQVIFGSPLRRKREFRSRDIEALTVTQLGTGNYSKTLSKLIELGWIRSKVRLETRTTDGRPSRYVYSRTEYGWQEYHKMVDMLALFDIMLQ